MAAPMALTTGCSCPAFCLRCCGTIGTCTASQWPHDMHTLSHLGGLDPIRFLLSIFIISPLASSSCSLMLVPISSNLSGKLPVAGTPASECATSMDAKRSTERKKAKKRGNGMWVLPLHCKEWTILVSICSNPLNETSSICSSGPNRILI